MHDPVDNMQFGLLPSNSQPHRATMDGLNLLIAILSVVIPRARRMALHEPNTILPNGLVS
jgi:hypothetical protein